MVVAGKPPDTLTTFDSSMKLLARDIMSSSSESYCLRRIRLVLDLMEQLDKSIVNASDGTAAALVAPSKSVRCFFSTNKSTCSEWLHRLRNTLMCVSLHAGMASSAARHGMALLQELGAAGHTNNMDLETGVLYLSVALLRLRDADGIHGLAMWCRNVARVSPAYLKCLEAQAADKWEAGGEELLQVLTQEEGKYPEVTRRLLSDQLVACYLAVEDWDSLGAWLSTERSRKYSHWSEKDIDMMKRIDREEYTSARELAEWQCTHEDMQSVPYYYKLEHVKHALVKYLVHKSGTNAIPTCCTQQVEQCRDICLFYVKESMRNVPCELLEDSFLCYYMAQCLLNNTELCFETNEEEASLSSRLLTQILWWKETMQGIARCSHTDTLPTAVDTIQNSKLYLSVAKTARKEGNIKLASRKMNKYINKICPLGVEGQTSSLTEYVTHFNSNAYVIVNSLDKVKAFKEITKLYYGYYSKETGIELCTNVIRQLSQYIALENIDQVKEINARLLLRLTHWLNVNEAPSISLWNMLNATRSTHTSRVSEKSVAFIMSCGMTDMEYTIYNLIQESIQQCPELSKSWHSLGNWSYRRGKDSGSFFFTIIYIAITILKKFRSSS